MEPPRLSLRLGRPPVRERSGLPVCHARSAYVCPRLPSINSCSSIPPGFQVLVFPAEVQVQVGVVDRPRPGSSRPGISFCARPPNTSFLLVVCFGYREPHPLFTLERACRFLQASSVEVAGLGHPSVVGCFDAVRHLRIRPPGLCRSSPCPSLVLSGRITSVR